LNFVAGQTIPNAVSTGVNANGDIEIYNNSGNSHVIVDVTGWYAKSDTEAPQLRSLSWTPSSVNTSTGAQTITVTFRVTDDLSGAGACSQVGGGWAINFRSPSGQWAGVNGGNAIATGTALDCVVEASMSVRAFAESGVWTVDLAHFGDMAGNDQLWNASQLAANGFPTTFTNN
jgi:hypothetical protein